MRFIFILLALLWTLPVFAADLGAINKAVVDQHILPGFARLAERADALNAAAKAECAPASEPLRAAYNAAFDAWLGVSHLRFGPTETGDRGFALAFWPDPKGFTSKTLRGLIMAEDPAVNDPAKFAHVSIAGRGFYALEFLLYDDAIRATGTPEYRCKLTRAVAADIDSVAHAILTDWQESYADVLLSPGEGTRYRSREEAAQELFKALTAGLQFTADTRLGRPLGSFDRPRPKRAEAWRSGRSLHNVVQALEALQSLAVLLSGEHEDLARKFKTGFAETFDLTAKLDDPVFAGVADPSGRLRVEILQQSIERIRALLATDLGPTLGVAAGFNALDGD
ncbi:imelysin family protein [Aquicoccus sp. G2-2]|uniref:imelysin family protein n=1 Tax=Aquicoccus sp. G2-2 TaxID=3092120 RepID=UPI002AE0383D|nr:imelysin family protein [Aquicoccus sp. G2-2]MEA1112305.1 imelysin family protein [Aquicoccus sp. G2-2]